MKEFGCTFSKSHHEMLNTGIGGDKKGRHTILVKYIEKRQSKTYQYVITKEINFQGFSRA